MRFYEIIASVSVKTVGAGEANRESMLRGKQKTWTEEQSWERSKRSRLRNSAKFEGERVKRTGEIRWEMCRQERIEQICILGNDIGRIEYGREVGTENGQGSEAGRGAEEGNGESKFGKERVK